MQPNTHKTLLTLNPTEIEPPPDAIRQNIDPYQLTELADSIRSVGLIEPIIIRKEDHHYTIIAGHRRYLACLLAKLPTITCVVDEADRDTALVRALHENLFRQDPTDLEYAETFQRLIQQQRFTPQQIATCLGKSEAFVRARLEIVTMPDSLQQALAQNKISLSVARELASIDDLGELARLLHFAIENGITARTAAAWRQAYHATHAGADQLTEIKPPDNPGGPPPPPHYPCYFCGTAVVFHDLILLRSCAPCLKQLHDAMQPTKA